MRQEIDLSCGWSVHSHAGAGTLPPELTFKLPCALHHAEDAPFSVSRPVRLPADRAGGPLVCEIRGCNAPYRLFINGEAVTPTVCVPFFRLDVSPFVRGSDSFVLTLIVEAGRLPRGVFFLRGVSLTSLPLLSLTRRSNVAFLTRRGDISELCFRCEISNASDAPRRVRFGHVLTRADGKKSKKWGGVCTLEPGTSVTVENREPLSDQQLASFGGRYYLLCTDLEADGVTVDALEAPLLLDDFRISARGSFTRCRMPFRLHGMAERPEPSPTPLSDTVLEAEDGCREELGIDTLFLPLDLNVEKRLEHLDRTGGRAIVALPVPREAEGADDWYASAAVLCGHPSLLAWHLGTLGGDEAQIPYLRAAAESLRLLSPGVLLCATADLRTTPREAGLCDFLLFAEELSLLPQAHRKYPALPLVLWVAGEEPFFDAYETERQKDYCMGMLVSEGAGNASSLCRSGVIRTYLGRPCLSDRLRAAWAGPGKAPFVSLLPASGEEIGPGRDVLALTNCPRLSLWVDGRPLPGVEMRGEPFCRFSLSPDFYGYIQAVAFSRDEEAARVEYEAVLAPYALSGRFVKLSGKSGKLEFLLLCAVDSEGREVSSVCDVVTLTVKGGYGIVLPGTAATAEIASFPLCGGRGAVPLLRISAGPVEVDASCGSLIPLTLRA